MDLWIVATPECVGRSNGELPWEGLPGYETRFEEITREAGIMIVGFNTYVFLFRHYKGLLPNRRYIVLTQKHIPSGCKMLEFVNSPQEALDAAARHGKCACVIGGKQVIELFSPLPTVTKVFLL